MIWLYRKHLELQYDKYERDPIPQKRETFFSFERWRALYEADEENWDFYIDKDYYTIVPFYNVDNGVYIKRHYIKFLTRKDFRKFIKYIRIKERTGQTVENIQEQLFLVEQISNNLKRKNKELSLKADLKAALKEDKKEDNDYSLKLESGDKTYEFPYR